VHGLARPVTADAPGLTPLTGQYGRPGPLWVCYDRGSLELTHTTDHDDSDIFQFCVLAEQVELTAKLIYYGARALKVLRGLPPPIAP
jgi:hypothetical protein